MKIIADNKIPFLEVVLEPYAEIIYKAGAETSATDVASADALITRTRTRCDARLLKGSSVKMIATATVGFDHIDTQYCENNGIHWVNAPGCNSGSVLQYVAATLALLVKELNYQLKDKKIAIIGVGHVGSKVEHLCRLFQMQVLPVDPIRAINEPNMHFVNYEEAITQADIITYHTPLTMDGQYATFHMLNNQTLSRLKKGVVIINAARGEVTHSEALCNGMNQGIIAQAIIDVWEHEPNINLSLLDKCWLATPHIAGYSLDSKANGTTMAVKSIADFFGLNMGEVKLKEIPQPLNPCLIANESLGFEQMMADLILNTYPIRDDDRRLRSAIADFEKQRGNYPLRREFAAYRVKCSHHNIPLVKAFGFEIQK